jgi:oxygen-independent coproporphyrinogen-3 oxidase
VTTRHLYIHVPFCGRRCTYCDFSIAVRRTVPVAAYLEALGREIALAGARPVETLYLGGGTPSRLGGHGIAALARLLRPDRDLAEFTLEANPEDVTAESVSAWVEAGVNRLSLGGQSFDDRVLSWMHRTHDAARIGEAVRAARAGGIANLSLDLIFALPVSLGRDWRRDLDAAVRLGPEHISLYGLTVEPGTPLFRQAGRGESVPADDARYEEEYLLAHERLTDAGYAFYEVSNAARPGREAVHNRAYWLLEPYLGLGPSAHSFDGVSRWWNEPAYARWKECLEQGQSPVAGHEILNDHQRRLEQMYLALRTSAGLAMPEPCPAKLASEVPRWIGAGWACESGRRLRLTPQGWLRLDSLVASI